MTKTVLQLRHKKTRWFCHGNFPSRLPTRLLSVKSKLDLLSKLFMGLRVRQVSEGEPGDQAAVCENNHTAKVPLSKTLNHTTLLTGDCNSSRTLTKKSIFSTVIK